MSIKLTSKDLFSHNSGNKDRATSLRTQYPKQNRLSNTRSRKKIFDTVPSPQKKKEPVDISNLILIKKIEQLQCHIIQLTKKLQEKQKNTYEVDEKAKAFLELKSKQCQKYIVKMRELTQQLQYKSRQIQSLKMEIIRISRCNKLIKQNSRLSQITNNTFQPNHQILQDVRIVKAQSRFNRNRVSSKFETPPNNQVMAAKDSYAQPKNFLSPFSINQNRLRQSKSELKVQDMKNSKKNYYC